MMSRENQLHEKLMHRTQDTIAEQTKFLVDVELKEIFYDITNEKERLR